MADKFTQYLFEKRKGVTFVVLILAFVLGAAITGLPRNFAAHAASATLAISPTARSYNPPDSLIGVTAAHYCAHEIVNVYWKYTGASTRTREDTSTNTTSGSFTFYWAT